MKKTILKFTIIIFSLIILVNCGNSDDKEGANTEICDNGIDDDSDGFTDCEDNDCVCEICDNGIDDDGDGFLDGEDSDCN